MDMETKYAINTPQIRNWLESKGYKGLSFFQGKKFVYAFLTTWRNKSGEWKEKDYSTFEDSDIERMNFLNENVSSEQEFKEYVESLTQPPLPIK